MNFNKEKLTGICSICGDSIGAGFDHAECAKVKQEIFGGSGERKRSRKYTKKQCESSADFFRHAAKKEYYKE